MDEGTKCRVPIGDACVSMRVCFDSLCFSSTQQRLADEEDASQLPTHGAVAVVAAAGQRAISNVTGATTITAMGTLRELQELLRVKDEKIAELEALLCHRDAEIQELRSHLDKFLSVLPFKSPLTPTKPRPRKQRAQGISAEPPLQELATLTDTLGACTSGAFHSILKRSLFNRNSETLESSEGRSEHELIETAFHFNKRELS
ncbi:unnamed protein product, partial [Heterotrigona itama]